MVFGWTDPQPVLTGWVIPEVLRVDSDSFGLQFTYTGFKLDGTTPKFGGLCGPYIEDILGVVPFTLKPL